MKLLTIGTYDTPHIGHAVFLKQCSLIADDVVVGVRSDEMVKQFRGHPPAFSFFERARLIDQLGYRVIKSDEPGAALIRKENPDFLAIGSDWIDRDIFSRYGINPHILTERGIALVYFSYTDGISTTELKKRLR